MKKNCVLLKNEARTITGSSNVVNPSTPSHAFLGSVGEMISFSIFLHFICLFQNAKIQQRCAKAWHTFVMLGIFVYAEYFLFALGVSLNMSDATKKGNGGNKQSVDSSNSVVAVINHSSQQVQSIICT